MPTGQPADDATLSSVRKAVARVVHGKDEIIELCTIALLAAGHVLIEDIPGVGKSTLARSFAQAVGGAFHRIQFTSDLLPGDVLGVNVWLPASEEFEFRPGPLFANFVLADEINRAPPRTQSALLEAMGERQVSMDGHSHALPRPFMVIATQNPIEHYGTYPLPESQRDRFLLRLAMGYADHAVEARLLQSDGDERDAPIVPVTTAAEVANAQDRVREVFVHEDLARYAQAVVHRSRTHDQIRLGVSTRGALAWIRGAKAKAFLSRRSQVSIDDLQELAVPALAHRLLTTHGTGESAHVAAEELIREILITVPVPP